MRSRSGVWDSSIIGTCCARTACAPNCVGLETEVEKGIRHGNRDCQDRVRVEAHCYDCGYLRSLDQDCVDPKSLGQESGHLESNGQDCVDPKSLGQESGHFESNGQESRHFESNGQDRSDLQAHKCRAYSKAQ